MKNALIYAAIFGAVVGLCVLAGLCKADCVLAFHGPGCVPCMRMERVEKQLCGEGYDVRTLDVKEHKQLAAKYHVTRWPQYVRVSDGEHMTGECSAGKLRRFCKTKAAWLRNAIRSAFGCRLLEL